MTIILLKTPIQMKMKIMIMITMMRSKETVPIQLKEITLFRMILTTITMKKRKNIHIEITSIIITMKDIIQLMEKMYKMVKQLTLMKLFL
jgi:integrase